MELNTKLKENVKYHVKDANIEGNRRYVERHKSREFLPIGVYYIDIKSVHLGRVRDGRKINKSFQLNV